MGNFETKFVESSIEDFLSKDKTKIYLPIPLGTTLYTYMTDCCDICYSHKELRKKIDSINDGKCIKCASLAPCHTRFKDYVHEVEVTIDNLDYILKYYGVLVFDTPEEARQNALERVEEHKNYLRQFGLEFNEEGKLIE